MAGVTHRLEAHVLGEGDWIGATEICRLCWLDLEGAVVLEPGCSRNQLPDDDVFLETEQAVHLPFQGGIGEHLRRLLEGGGGEE